MTKLSIIIPTYNEGGNVLALVQRINTALPSIDAEIIFVDDSSDDTPRIAAEAGLSSRIPVLVHHREGAARVGGVSGAVKAGYDLAKGYWMLVMDGDLQHPPEIIPTMLNVGDGRAVDVVVASRYVDGGDAGGLAGGVRRLVSMGSTHLARTLFPRRLRHCTDPMTGFFMVRKGAVDMKSLQPQGFKILLEILARHDLAVAEVPFTFGDRVAGESKASLANGLTFLRQLFMLRTGNSIALAIVGLLGTLVNLLALSAIDNVIPYLVASVIATEIAIGFNFTLQEKVVFNGAQTKRSLRQRLYHTYFLNNTLVCVTTPLLWLMVTVWGFNDILSQAALLAASFVARISYTTRVVYRLHSPVVLSPAVSEVGVS